MAKKKSPEKKVEKVVEEVIEKPVEEETVTCPSCGKPVGLTVPKCPHCGAEFEDEVIEEIVEEEPAKVEAEEEVTCPVCGKPVGMSVTSCPYCGAEFEEEEVEEEAMAAAPSKAETPPAAVKDEGVSEEEEAECPVCGTMVSLSVSACPVCGAEFEEEEIEEVVEVEEVPAAPARPPRIVSAEEEVVVEEEEPAVELAGPPTSIADLRVIGISLILLGILGSQISFMIDWYWTWVPPIEDNLGMFVGIAAAVVVVGLVAFTLLKRSSVAKKKATNSMLPAICLSLFLFGIIAVILVLLWNPINSALQDSSLGVGGAFVAILVIGLLSVFMGNRMATPKGSAH